MKEITSDNVIAYFQPILSVDSNTTHEEALKIDRMVRRYAMKKYAEEKRTEYLFINIRLAWLQKFADRPDELPTIQWAREFGIAADNRFHSADE